MPCATPPMDLAVHDQRIDDAPAVLDDDVAQDLHRAGRGSTSTTARCVAFEAVP